MEKSSDWRPAELLGSLSDVKEEYREGVADLQHLLDAATDGLFVLDEDWTVQFVSDGLRSWLDVDCLVDSPVGEVLADPTGPVDIVTTDDVREAVEKAQVTSDLEAELAVADGRAVPVTVTAVSLESDAGVACLVQKRAAGDSRQYQTVVETIADPIYVLDEWGDIQQVNDAMVEYTGYEREELLGRSVGEIIPAQEYEAVTDTLRSTRPKKSSTDDGREAQTLETTLVTSDGELLLTEARVTALTDDEGMYAGSVGVLRDIQDRKERERDLELLKEVLTRVFRHNIRNELMVIQSHAEIATGDADNLETHLNAILDTSQRLLDHSEKARLIERVIETDELRDVDLAAAVVPVIDRLRDRYPDAVIDVDVPDGTTVVAHPDIRSAIEELLENAIVHGTGRPTVELWTEEHANVHTLYVRDQSGGLSDHELDVLREGSENRFEHTSGVGLWLVRWLVEYSRATLLVHRTASGTLMGLRFYNESEEQRVRAGASPVTQVPAKVRELEHAGGSIVGRTEELHELENHYDATKRTGGHAVFIGGEAGVGKTTLVEEFRTRLAAGEDPPLIGIGRCGQDVARPYHGIRQVLDVLDVDQQLLGNVSSGIDDDPAAVRDRRQALFADIAAAIRERAADQPFVLLLEDVHWADPTTVELLEYLLEEVGRWALPVLFVGTYQSGEVDGDHPLSSVLSRVDDRGREQLLELTALNRDDVGLLLQDVLSVEALPDEFLDAVYAHTGGSPLFVDALGRHIADQLQPDATASDLPTDPDEIALLDSVESAVTDRLTALDESTRTVLELGAVVGDRASLDVLLEASARSTTALLAEVDTLVETGLWERRAGEIRFVHGLMRERALETIDEGRRRELHARVAQAIEEVYDDSRADHAGRLAVHYHEADRLDDALAYYRRAGDQSMEVYAHERALEQYRTGRELAREVDDRAALLGLTERVADVSLTVGEYNRVTECVQLLRERVDPDEMGRRQRIALLEARNARSRGEFDAAIEAATAGIEIDRTASETHCRLLGQKGSAQRQQGRYGPARETAQRQLDMATDLGDARLEGNSYRKLGVIAKNEGEYEQAASYQEQALKRFESVGDRKHIADVHTHLGVIADMRGSYDDAVYHYRQARETYEEMSHRQNRAYVQTNLGAVAMERGQYDRAEEAFMEALSTFEELGDVHARGTTRLNLGELTQQRGEFDRAREFYREALTELQEVGDRHTVAMAREGIASTAAAQGEYVHAQNEAEDARAVYEDIDNETDIGRVLTTLGTIARRQGDTEAAREHLEAALAAFRSVGDDHRIGTPRLELARLDRQEGALDDAARHIEQAMATAEEAGDESLAAECHRERGQLARRHGETETACKQFDAALELCREMGDTHGVATVKRHRGLLARDEGRLETARSLFVEACESFVKHDAYDDALRTHQLLVETCREDGEDEQARTWCRRASELLTEVSTTLEERHEQWVTRQREELKERR